MKGYDRELMMISVNESEEREEFSRGQQGRNRMMKKKRKKGGGQGRSIRVDIRMKN